MNDHHPDAQEQFGEQKPAYSQLKPLFLRSFVYNWAIQWQHKEIKNLNMKLKRKSLLGLLALGFLLSCTQSPEEKVRNATVHVTRELTDRPTGGSGFFIEPDQIVTNIHVIAGDEPVYVTDIVGTMYHIEGVIGSDPKYDLVILKVSGKGTPLSLSNGRIGEPIFVAGYPLGGEYEITGGAVHGIRDSDEYIRLKVRFLDGNSGGPVVNFEGKVIGVAVSRSSRSVVDVASFGYAAPSNALKALLTRSGQVQPLDEWRKEDPIHAYYWFASGQNMVDDEAIKDFDEAINLYGDFASAYFYRGNAKRKLGLSEVNGGNTEKARDFYNAAIIDYDEVIKLIPDYVQAYLYRGATKFHLGELEADGGQAEKARNSYNAAIIDYDEVIKLNPDYVQAYFGHAGTKFRLGELEADGGQAEKARNSYNAAIIDYDEVIKLNPDYVQAYLYRGATKFRVGELEIDRGQAEKARDFYNAAIIDYDEAIERTPDDAEAYFFRGAAKFYVSELETDRGQAEKAWSLHDEAAEDWNKAVELSSDRRDYIDKMIVFLDKAIESYPDSVRFYYIKGKAKKVGGRQEEAEVDFEKAQDRYSAAIIDYDEVIERNPDDAEAYFNRGLERAHFSLMEADGGQAEKAWSLYDEAVEDWNKAIELSSDRRDYYIDKMIVFLDKAIESYPDSARFYYSRGLRKKARGKQQEAGADFEKAKALDPDVGR